MATQNGARSSSSSSSHDKPKRIVVRSRKPTSGLNEVSDILIPSEQHDVFLATSTPLHIGCAANVMRGNTINGASGGQRPHKREDSSSSHSSADDEVFFRPPLPASKLYTTSPLSVNSRPPIFSVPTQNQIEYHPVVLSALKTPSRISLPALSSSPLAPLLTSSVRRNSLNLRNSIDHSDHATVLDTTLINRTLKVFVGTWNMHEEKDLSSLDLEDFLLPLSQESVADLYAIGSQESTPNRSEWEILVQQTLGPTHVLIHYIAFGSLYLYIFLRRDLIWYCSEVQSSSFATRPITAIKTKGAVGIRLMLFGSRFLFINSHFSAGFYNTIERNSDMHKILNNLTFSDQKSNLFSTNDFIIWCGDFNYRVDMERDETDKAIQERNLTSMLLHDQLTCEILAGNVFNGFSEQPISFLPSYKYDIHSDEFDTSELRRVPSWTDRVLFRALHEDTIIGCGYDICQNIKISDHRPVYGVFKVIVKPCDEIYGIPINSSGYNRDIYNKALKKRKDTIASITESKKIEEEQDAEINPPVTVTRLKSTTKSTTTSALCFIL